MKDLIGSERRNNARLQKITVLRRHGGVWSREEVGRLINGLITETTQHPRHPEFVLLFGHHSGEKIHKVLGGKVDYITFQVTGIDSEALPYPPGFV